MRQKNNSDTIFMERAISLALLGRGHCAPNPIVGAVIVYNNRIIGEGYHRKCGEAHAEVNAIDSVSLEDRALLPLSTIYVTLEPCSHYGKTPPCAELIIETKIGRVVIGVVDPFAKVSGRGVAMLQEAGIKVETGVLEQECADINREFFTFHSKKRPYIILKWAESRDGYIDGIRDKEKPNTSTPISNEIAKLEVHKDRSHYMGIAVGTNTALNDNPSLSIREWSVTQHPTRIILDRELRLPLSLEIFKSDIETIIFTESNQDKTEYPPHIKFEQIDFKQEVIPQLLSRLFKRGIQSLYVEGGTTLLESFIKSNLWDEAHRYIGDITLNGGVLAPVIRGEITSIDQLNSTSRESIKRR